MPTEAQRVLARKRLKKVKIKQRDYVRSVKNDQPCTDCGQKYPFYIMQFDHREPDKKEFTIGRIAQLTPSMERLKAEIAKCDLVCANCHASRSHFQREKKFN